MALSTFVGSFLKIGTVATQAITGVGFQPKVVLLFTSYQGTVNVYDANWSISYAVRDGAATFGRSSVTTNAAGPAAGTAGATRQAAALPIIGLSGAGTPSLLAEAAVSSLDADGFTLNWTTNDGGTTQRIMYLALGGADLTGVKLMSFAGNGRVGQQAVTGMGFRPNAVLFLPGFSASVPTNVSEVHHALGCGISADEQWALFGWSKATSTRPSYATRHQRDDRCLVLPAGTLISASDSQFDGTDRTLVSEAKFVSRDLDGFTIDWQQPDTQTVYCLGLKGGRYRAGSLLKLQGSQSQAVKQIPFQPSFMLLTGDGRHEESLNVSAPLIENKLTLGAATAAASASIAAHDLDGTGRSSGSSNYEINARIMSTTILARTFEAALTPTASAIAADATLTSFDADGFTIQWGNADSLRRQYFYLVGAGFTTAGACTGGGSAPATTDPSADATLASARTPVVFVEIALDSGTKRYAKVPLADPSSYFGGYKEARLLSISRISRALSDLSGEFQTASVQVTLDDTDRALRALEAAGTLTNRRVDVYAVDDVDRRAGTAARRLGSFVIRKWKALGDLQFSLELEDWFGSQLSEYNQGKLLPQRTFTKSIFGGLPDALVGVPEPIGYGSLSDESNGTDAIGVVPLYYTGQETVGGFAWDRYVAFGHAIKSIQSWYASDLGANPTGTPRRIKMPAGTEGVDFLIPGNSGWNAATGSANTYRDYGGRRYTVIFARGPRSDQHKNGTVEMALNVCGIETVGDGSGTMISALPSQLLHALTNHVAQNYLTGAWLAVPSSNGYSQLKSVAAVNTAAGVRIAGGYIGAFILGGSQGQVSVHDFMKMSGDSCDVQLGINRHGQLLLSMEDAAAASVATFVDVNDIDENGLDIDIGWEQLANRVPYRYVKNYLPPASAEDPALPWAVDTAISDGAAQTAHLQQKSTPVLELPFVRDTTTGDDVVAKVLARRSGGAAPYRGPVYANVRLGLNGTVADLGDNVTITHFAGLGAGGWVAQKVRVFRVDIDPDTCGVTLRVKVV